MSIRCLIILLLVLLTTGCAATRTTTTEHTAVEQALLTYTSRKAFSTVDFSVLANRNVYIEKVVLPHRYPKPNLGTNSQWHEINPVFIRALLERELLKVGANVVNSEEKADTAIRLLVDIAAIDDSEFVMGLPSIPIPLAGAATLSTPEISIFSSRRQTGKVRFSVYAKDTASNKMSFFKKSKASRKYYTRWSFLLLFGWRVTDLGEPF